MHCTFYLGGYKPSPPLFFLNLPPLSSSPPLSLPPSLSLSSFKAGLEESLSEAQSTTPTDEVETGSSSTYSLQRKVEELFAPESDTSSSTDTEIEDTEAAPVSSLLIEIMRLLTQGSRVLGSNYFWRLSSRF